MNIRKYACLSTVLLGLSPQPAARAGDFYYPFGVGISSGHIDVFDRIEDSYRAAGFNIAHSTLVPVGLSFSPYYEFDFGLGVGLSLGPTAFFDVHEQNYGGPSGGPGGGPGGGPMGNDNNKFSYIVPVGADVRYTFLRDRVISPYAKVGIRYPIAGGDNLSSFSRPGPYGGVGVTFMHTRWMAFGVEFGYDASQVTVKGSGLFGGGSRVTYSGFTGSLFVEF